MKLLTTTTTKHLKTKSSSKCINPWITPGLVHLIRQRDKLAKLANKNPENVNLKSICKNIEIMLLVSLSWKNVSIIPTL